MPVMAVPRNVLRGRIRAQVQYQTVLGERLIRAYELNPDLLIFTGDTGAGSKADFAACLFQMSIALLTRS